MHYGVNVRRELPFGRAYGNPSNIRFYEGLTPDRHVLDIPRGEARLEILDYGLCFVPKGEMFADGNSPFFRRSVPQSNVRKGRWYEHSEYREIAPLQEVIRVYSNEGNIVVAQTLEGEPHLKWNDMQGDGKRVVLFYVERTEKAKWGKENLKKVVDSLWKLRDS